MKRVILLIIAITLVGFIGFKVKQKMDLKAELSLSAFTEKGRGPGEAAMVKTLRVSPTKIKETLRMVGEIIPETEVAVQPRINGRLLTLLVEEGDLVKAGQLLAILDDEMVQIELRKNATEIATVKADLNQAESDLIQARAEKERYYTLLEKKYVSQQEYENKEKAFWAAQNEVDNYKSKLQNAEDDYALTKIQLKQTKVTAPITGYILTKPVTAGVNVTTGTTLATIASLNPVKIKFNIDQRNATKAFKGAEVTFTTDAFPGQSFYGKVNDSAPSYDTRTRTLSLSVVLPNRSTKLLPGMFGTVELSIGNNDHAWVVPQEAIINRNGRNGLFIVNQKGIAEWKSISTGLISEGQIEITSGLKTGDLVVVIGQNRLRDGDSVQLLGGRGGKDKKNKERQNKGGRQERGGGSQ